jgi:hypothetical protein
MKLTKSFIFDKCLEIYDLAKIFLHNSTVVAGEMKK